MHLLTSFLSNFLGNTEESSSRKDAKQTCSSLKEIYRAKAASATASSNSSQVNTANVAKRYSRKVGTR